MRPAAGIGNQQVRWAKFYVKRWNAKKANRNKRIKMVPGDTQLGVEFSEVAPAHATTASTASVNPRHSRRAPASARRPRAVSR